MNLDEYIEHHAFKPLTAKELEKGKSHIKIYGTQDTMPWSTIYTRLAAGQPIEELVKMYGHKRQIALWARLEGVTPQQPLIDVLEQEVTHRKTVQAIAKADPTAAATLMEMVNEIAPDFTQEVALFSSELVQKSRDLLKGKYIEATDVVNLAKAVQIVTDSVGVTTRHAAAASKTVNHIAVTGFSFLPDIAPEDVTEATIIPEENNNDNTD